MECILAGETQVLGGNLPQRHFCPSQNPTWPDPGLNPGRRSGKSMYVVERRSGTIKLNKLWEQFEINVLRRQEREDSSHVLVYDRAVSGPLVLALGS
jgi:hypothetical protein